MSMFFRRLWDLEGWRAGFVIYDGGKLAIEDGDVVSPSYSVWMVPGTWEE